MKPMTMTVPTIKQYVAMTPTDQRDYLVALADEEAERRGWKEG